MQINVGIFVSGEANMPEFVCFLRLKEAARQGTFLIKMR